MRVRAPIALWCAALLVTLLVTPAVHAKDPPVRRVGAQVQDQGIRVTFGFRDAFSKKVKAKLKSGLPTRVVVQVVVENQKKKPVAFWARTAHVVYDLWEENFVVTIKDPGGKRTTRVKTVGEVANAACVLWRAQVAAKLEPGTYRVKVLVEANPVSEKMVRNIQRWISKPSGDFARKGTATNYFGSFVGYFVDRNIGKADKTVQFVSQWFEI